MLKNQFYSNNSCTEYDPNECIYDEVSSIHQQIFTCRLGATHIYKPK